MTYHRALGLVGATLAAVGLALLVTAGILDGRYQSVDPPVRTLAQETAR
jgi:hypothetical protein